MDAIVVVLIVSVAVGYLVRRYVKKNQDWWRDAGVKTWNAR